MCVRSNEGLNPCDSVLLSKLKNNRHVVINSHGGMVLIGLQFTVSTLKFIRPKLKLTQLQLKVL